MDIVKNILGEKGKDSLGNMGDKVGSVDLNIVKKIYGDDDCD